MPRGQALPGEKRRARNWYRKGQSITYIAESMERPRETVRDWVADIRETEFFIEEFDPQNIYADAN